MQHKAYKFRSIPLKANDYTMGCARFVYHHLLCLWHMAYSEIGKGLSYNQCLAMVPKMKRVEEMEWLKEVDGIALQSYTTKYVNQNISIDGNLLKFSKIGHVTFAKSRKPIPNVKRKIIKNRRNYGDSLG